MVSYRSNFHGKSDLTSHLNENKPTIPLKASIASRWLLRREFCHKCIFDSHLQTFDAGANGSSMMEDVNPEDAMAKIMDGM